MSPEETETEAKREGRDTATKLITVLLGGSITLLSAWILGEWTNHTYLQNLISSMLSPGLSAPQVTLVVGFGGTMLSIPFLARRSRQKRVLHMRPLPVQAMSKPKVHPLMMTPRPARDSSFVIRKTSKKGRISRNRDGERLPAVNHE